MKINIIDIETVLMIIAMVLILTILTFGIGHYVIANAKIETGASVEIHRLWSDALQQSVETICDRFLVLNIDGENVVVEE